MRSDPPNADPPKRKRRWLQFSLRSLMIFTLLCAIGSAWVETKLEKKRKEREAVEAIVKLEGCVIYDYEMGTGAKLSGPDWLRELLGENVFSHVDWVYLGGTRVTDAGLENLEQLTQLQSLSIDHTIITDAGLAHVKKLTQLRFLDLRETSVTDDGLVNLKGMTQLQSLMLSDTNVTDAGLQHLKGLTQLKALTLWNTKVTVAGVTDLQKALPNCIIGDR